MTNAYSQTEDFEAAGLKVVRDFLSLCVKCRETPTQGLTGKRRGFVKSYAENSSVVALHLHVGWANREYLLVFHRIPNRLRDQNEPTFDERLSHIANLGNDPYPDGVLPIGKLGQCAEKVIAAGVSLTSLVWLLPFYHLPKVGGDIFAREISFDLDGPVAPREIRVLPRLADCYTGGVKTLVERVPDVVERLGSLSSKPARRGFQCLDLKALILGLTVRLQNDTHVLRAEELVVNGIQLLDSFSCPIDSFARAIELRELASQGNNEWMRY